MKSDLHPKESAGILVEYDASSHIHTVSLRVEPDRDTVDQLLDVFLQLADQTPPELPLKVLLDLSHPTMHFSPYGQQQGDTLYKLLPAERCVLIAICVKDTILNRILSLLSHRRKVRFHHIQERTFADYQSAKAWLLSV